MKLDRRSDSQPAACGDVRESAWCDPQRAREAKPPDAGVAGGASLRGWTSSPSQGHAVDAPTVGRFSLVQASLVRPPERREHPPVPPRPPSLCLRSAESSRANRTDSSGATHTSGANGTTRDTETRPGRERADSVALDAIGGLVAAVVLIGLPTGWLHGIAVAVIVALGGGR